MMGRIDRARTYVTGNGLGPFLIRAVAGSGAVQLAGMVVAFLVGVQLARGLGVAGYGYYGIAMAIVSLVTIPGALGIPRLVTREVAAAEARKDLPALFGVLRWADRICWRTSAAIALAVAAGAAVAWRMSSASLALAILLGAPMIPLVPLSAIRGGALRGLHHVVLGQISNTFLRPLAISILLFAIFLAGFRIGAPVAMALNSLTALGALILTDRWLATRLPEPRVEPSTSNGRGWLASSIPMALADAVQTLQQQLSVLVLGLVAAPAVVGLFRVSISSLPVLAVPITVVNLVVLPMFARLHTEGDQYRLQKLVTATALVRFAGVLFLSLPLIIAAGPLLGLIFGKGYMPAADTLRILAIGMTVNSAFGPNAALLNMTGHERRVTRAVATSLLINVAVMALLAPKWGGPGAAMGILAGQIWWNSLLWLDARRRLSIETSIWGGVWRWLHPDATAGVRTAEPRP
jgi:O-antigen/teichoic acid export membrane protein